MIPGPVKELLKELISEKTNTEVRSLQLVPVGGGSINEAFRLTINSQQKLFLKLNSAHRYPGLFQKEVQGLQLLSSVGSIRLPSVIHYQTHGDRQLLIMEWIEGGIRDSGFWKKFGERLANLHTHHHAKFGLDYDNYMGSLPQSNSYTTDWIRFFIEHRLMPQISLAREAGHLDKYHHGWFEILFRKLSDIFNSEPAALLHGDLWSGNFMCDEHSDPVLIDPAVYYGHRSVDLAMTTLFGGFDRSFYDAYHHHYPLPSNYREQWEVANLYPLLIHLNLFGRSYLADINTTLKRYAG